MNDPIPPVPVPPPDDQLLPCLPEREQLRAADTLTAEDLAELAEPACARCGVQPLDAPGPWLTVDRQFLCPRCVEVAETEPTRRDLTRVCGRCGSAPAPYRFHGQDRCQVCIPPVVTR